VLQSIADRIDHLNDLIGRTIAWLTLGMVVVTFLVVLLSTPTDCVAPLDKGAAIACEGRLAVNVDKLTELAIITLKEH
jgi:hypothetical protein